MKGMRHLQCITRKACIRGHRFPQDVPSRARNPSSELYFGWGHRAVHQMETRKISSVRRWPSDFAVSAPTELGRQSSNPRAPKEPLDLHPVHLYTRNPISSTFLRVEDFRWHKFSFPLPDIGLYYRLYVYHQRVKMNLNDEQSPKFSEHFQVNQYLSKLPPDWISCEVYETCDMVSRNTKL